MGRSWRFSSFTLPCTRESAVVRLACLALACTLLLSGCSSSRATNPYSTPTDADRNSLRAQELNQKAADLMDEEPEKAERLLREALGADLFYGPAHNNLGVLFLKQGKLYEAAHEFEWAGKLMPGNPDPRVNLALTLERAGRIDEALAAYATALEVSPNYLPAVKALCRCQLRHGRADERTDDMLKEIALRGETEQWRAWAQREMTRSMPSK